MSENTTSGRARGGGRPQARKWVVYFRACAVALILTGVAKLVSASGHAKILQEMDPMFRVSYRTLFVVVGGAEVFGGGYLLFSADTWLRSLVAAFFGTNFLLYRGSILLLGAGPKCPCLGEFGERLHLSDAVTGWILVAISVALVAGGGLGLRHSSRRSGSDDPPSEAVGVG